jgi:histidinol dehydrogenase
MTFQKISKKDYKISETIEIMAEAEGLQAHKMQFLCD